MIINLNTKAKDVFKILISNLSATQFIELYKIMTKYMEDIKNGGTKELWIILKLIKMI